jgi:hypothetical protein
MSNLIKHLEKLAKKLDKKKKVNPYLAAGIPLTIAAGLGLPGAIPASKMGIKLLKSKFLKKPYNPSEFVHDYLAMSEGMGKSVYNPLLKKVIVRSKSLADRADEAVHWDEFTKGRKNGLARWLYEIEREAGPSRGGNQKKQKALSDKINKFKEQVKNNPDNINAVADNRESQLILARMAKMHAPYAGLHSKLGLGNVGVFGAGLGLTGKGVYDETQKTASFEEHELLDDQDSKIPELTKGLGAVGLLGLSGAQLDKANKLVNSNTIGVTAGKLNEPIVSSSIGGGHEAPMEAIYEALKNHEAVQSGEFKLDKLLRTNEGKTEVFKHTGVNPSKNWLTTVETGFGGTMTTTPSFLQRLQKLLGFGAFGFGAFKKSPVWHNPYGQVLFLPDAPPKDSFFKKIHGVKNSNIFDRTINDAGTDLITFGPDYFGDYRGEDRVFNSPVAHPAIADETIANAEKRLVAGTDRTGVLQKLLDVSRKNNDQRSIAALTDAINTNKKIYTISGATRGDQVAIRTKELLESLKKRNMDKDSMVLALLGENKGTPVESLLNNMEGVATLPKLDRNLYIDAQNIADAHWASPGASSQAESMMSPVPTATTKLTGPERNREIEQLMAGGVNDPKLLDKLRMVDMDYWSPGNKRWLEQRSKHKAGIGAINTAEDFLDFVKHMESVPKHELNARAKDYMLESREMKKRMADAIVNRARLAKTLSQRGAAMANLAGGAGLLGGGLLTFSALKNYLARKRHEK